MPDGRRRRATAAQGATRAGPRAKAVVTGVLNVLARLRGRRLAAALAGVAVVVAATAWALWPSGPPPRTRQYLAFKACLLTDSTGLSDKQAASVWSGMEKASLKTRARVQYLPAFGPKTLANTQPYLRSLFQRRCDVILAVGEAPVSAVTAEAARHPKTRFVVAGPGGGPNVTSVQADSPELTAVISDAVVHAVRAG
ncbi:hypothetical protein AB0L00_30270 [Actinoallomurus sp. NPDC052308]|uniref:hypothetical protein n=1 Tax=Actinoallomurus sp. NPDC052308 TaxID=3155530 RepID=UPI0034211D1D